MFTWFYISEMSLRSVIEWACFRVELVITHCLTFVRYQYCSKQWHLSALNLISATYCKIQSYTFVTHVNVVAQDPVTPETPALYYHQGAAEQLVQFNNKLIIKSLSITSHLRWDRWIQFTKGQSGQRCGILVPFNKISAFLQRYIQVFIDKYRWMRGEYIDTLAKDCGNLVQQSNYTSIALSNWYVLSDAQKQKTKLDLA